MNFTLTVDALKINLYLFILCCSLQKKNLNYISTVTYLNVPKKDKGLFYYFFQNEENLEHRIIEPSKNMVVIMPSWIYHGVYPQGKGLRQTLNLDFEYIIK